MSPIHITMEGRLPGLNQLISSRGRPWWRCQNTKAKAMRDIQWFLLRFKVPKFTKPIKIKFEWIEPNGRRDRDNVMSGGSKIFLDAMKHLELIKDDSRRWIADIQHDTSQIDKHNPRVEVWIEEVA